VLEGVEHPPAVQVVFGGLALQQVAHRRDGSGADQPGGELAQVPGGGQVDVEVLQFGGVVARGEGYRAVAQALERLGEQVPADQPDQRTAVLALALACGQQGRDVLGVERGGQGQGGLDVVGPRIGGDAERPLPAAMTARSGATGRSTAP